MGKVLLASWFSVFVSPIIFVGDLPCLALRPIQRGVIFNLGERSFTCYGLFQVWSCPTWWCPLSRGRSVSSSSYSSRLSSCRALSLLLSCVPSWIWWRWFLWWCWCQPQAEGWLSIHGVRGGRWSFWWQPASSPHPSKRPKDHNNYHTYS